MLLLNGLPQTAGRGLQDIIWSPQVTRHKEQAAFEGNHCYKDAWTLWHWKEYESEAGAHAGDPTFITQVNPSILK